METLRHLLHSPTTAYDNAIRKIGKLPPTHIKTDSYIAVQLIERKGKLGFDSLRYMAEQLDGSFAITVLDSASNLYIIKGDNQMCLYHYPKARVYIYASTEEILLSALKKLSLNLGELEKISIVCGEIMRINTGGKRTIEDFNIDNKKAAKKFLAELFIEYDDGELSPYNLTAADYFKRWLIEVKPKVKPNIYRSYHGNMTNHIIPYFEKKKLLLQELKPCHLNDYYRCKMQPNSKINSGEALSLTTIKHHHQNISKALADAFKRSRICQSRDPQQRHPKQNSSKVHF